jgi:uncharacterized protein (TIGR04255 family)
MDVRAPMTIDLTQVKLSDLLADLEDAYPTQMQLRRREFGIENEQDGAVRTSHTDHGVWGWRLESSDGCQIAQFRRDGFTFSRLTPYETWEDMFQEGKRLWDRFVEIGKPVEITRVATRFINALDLPLPMELDEYLTAPPLVPGEIAHEVSSFLTRTVFAAAQFGAQVIFTQALDSLEADVCTVVLDIDVFVEEVFEPSATVLNDRLSPLRELKNEVFFNSITEKAAERYA